jgi:TfoX/Sxy family transcriptional regulator of competence genes
MATRESVIEHLVAQLRGAGAIRVRKMFGEYALYCDDKVVALVCDDQLFVKPTDSGRSYLGSVEEAPPYPGSKPYFWIDEGKWDDAPWLVELIRLTAGGLPTPKPKKKRA